MTLQEPWVVAGLVSNTRHDFPAVEWIVNPIREFLVTPKVGAHKYTFKVNLSCCQCMVYKFHGWPVLLVLSFLWKLA